MSRPLIVLSHLRWDFVYQRPQHVLSRLAATRPVIVVEEPIHAPDCSPRLEVIEAAPGVTVLRAHTGIDEPGFSDSQLHAVAPLLQDWAEKQGWVGACDAWVYTPLATPLLDALSPAVVVYDCMDELSAFDHAPPGLLEREQQLLDRADLVFTGGPSLFNAKKDRHDSVHCFTSSVDAEHFGKARPEAASIEEPLDQRDLARPRLGFFGVIDERLDLAIVDALASEHPDWQIVMVGPVVKIDPATLPRRDNIHWLGGKEYAELPAYLAGWDVCLLPFARNKSTEFISPTKTLEYFAAERPTVSTSITDVAEPYGDIVYLGDSPGDFVAACESAMMASPRQRTANVADMREVIAGTSWDKTAGAMGDLLDAASETASTSASA